MNYYIKPYFFSSSVDTIQNINFWVWSSYYSASIGLAEANTPTTALALTSASGWQVDSIYPGASMAYSLTPNTEYLVVVSSEEGTNTGSFELRITEGFTSSIDLPTLTNLDTNLQTDWISRISYVSSRNKVFLVNTRISSSGLYGPYINDSGSLFVLNPITSIIETSSSFYKQTTFWDGIYNPYTDTIWVWATGSTEYWNGELFIEFDFDCNIVDSHSMVSAEPQIPFTNIFANHKILYNSASNECLLLRDEANNPSTASIYDFNTKTITTQIYFHDSYIDGVYVSSSNYYYICKYYSSDPVVKIDAITGASSSVDNMTGSFYGISYIPEIDKILLENDTETAVMVYDPATDIPVATIPGIIDMTDANFDSCLNCLLISDDVYGVINYMPDGGGICCVSTGSYQPINFLYNLFPRYFTYCSSVSTIWIPDYSGILNSMYVTNPTGSSFLPQPPYPPA